MRPIDADAFEEYLIKARENTYANEIHDCEDESQMTNINNELYYSTQSFIDVMRYRPTLETEPIVRCRNCTYRAKPLFTSSTLVWCPLLEHHKPLDWFCAYGKKEEKG